MKYIGLGLTLKLEINKMTYEEKIAFCKKHLGENMEFYDKGIRGYQNGILHGMNEGHLFIDDGGNLWSNCRQARKPKLIPWTLETAESVQLRHKTSGLKVWMNYGVTCFYDGHDTITYGSLLTDWETVDGRPCGTEVMG
jgi:hypothetical protein